MENSCIYSTASSRQTRKDISRPRFAFSDSLVKEPSPAGEKPVHPHGRRHPGARTPPHLLIRSGSSAMPNRASSTGPPQRWGRLRPATPGVNPARTLAEPDHDTDPRTKAPGVPRPTPTARHPAHHRTPRQPASDRKQRRQNRSRSSAPLKADIGTRTEAVKPESAAVQ